MGDAEESEHDHQALRKRSYEAYLKSPQVVKILDKLKVWLVGTGLQLQYTPKREFLEEAGISVEDWDVFQDKVETIFRLWAESDRVSLSGEDNLHSLACMTIDNIRIAGDMLVILRYDSVRWVTVELVSAEQILTPPGSKDNIVNGIEYNQYNEPVAFHVKKEFEYIKINARNDNGQLVAWMVYGLRGKFSSSRGIARLASVLELDSVATRLIESFATNAEMNSDIIYTLEHGVNSTGEDIFPSRGIPTGQTAQSTVDSASTGNCDKVIGKINKSVKGTAYNMPNDASLKRYGGEGANPQMTEFHSQITDNIYSTGGVAPEIAKDRYDGSYSAGRLLIETQRQQFEFDRYYQLERKFYTPIFRFVVQILMWEGRLPDFSDKITDAITEEAFYCASYLGIKLPEIDLAKKIKYIRESLGPAFANVPLMTLEDAIIHVSNKDAPATLDTLRKELSKIDAFKNVSTTSKGNI